MQILTKYFTDFTEKQSQQYAALNELYEDWNQKINVISRKDIEHFFAEMLPSGVRDIKLNTIKIWGDSSILVEEGSYQLLNKKGTQTDKGEYISLWQQESGNWKIYRDMCMSSVPKSAIKITDSSLIKH